MQSPFVSEAELGLLLWVHNRARWPQRCLQFLRSDYPLLGICFSEGIIEALRKKKVLVIPQVTTWFWEPAPLLLGVLTWYCSNRSPNQCLFGGGRTLIWSSKYEIFPSLQMNAGCVCIATTKRAVLCGEEQKDKAPWFNLGSWWLYSPREVASV